MAKRSRWWIGPLACILSVVLVVALAFAFFSAPFTPPADSPPPISRKFPLENQSIDATQADADSDTPTQPGDDSIWVEALVASFYLRHEGAADAVPENYLHDGSRKEFLDIAYLVLRGDEPHITLLELISHPDESVRLDAIKALGQAQNALSMDGFAALIRLWQQLDEKETDAVVAAASEALIRATQNGDYSDAQWFLYSIGDPGREALPLLIWASDHHPEPQMRVFTFNLAARMAPDDPEVAALHQRRLFDPSGIVRLNALQSVALETLANALGVEEHNPMTATSASSEKRVQSQEADKPLADSVS